MEYKNTNKNEVLFICYEDVIKSFKPFLFQKLQEPEFRDQYSELIDYSKIDNKRPDEIMALSISFYYKNIFRNLAKTEFDYDAVESEFSSKFDNLASESDLLAMGENIKLMLSCSFLKKVYIYIEKPDERILTDLVNTYDDERIQVIIGDLTKGLTKINDKITLFMLNDVKMIDKIDSAGIIQDACILIAQLGYNYTIDDEKNIITLNYDEEKSKTKNYGVGIFSVI